MSSREEEDLESTVDQPLLAPHDHTMLLRAVQVYTPLIIQALGARAKVRPLQPEPVLRAIASLPKADEKTRQTARQVLTFVGPLAHTPLPSSYEATLATIDQKMQAAPNPMAVVMSLMELKQQKAHERVPGFQIGVECALELLGDALGTAGTIMSGITVFGRKNPAAVAKACASGCLHGALVGTVNRVPPAVSGVVGGVMASTTKLIEVSM